MKYVVCFIIIALLSLPSTLLGVEIQGDISAETRLFFDSPAYEEQDHNNTSLSINTEIFKQINSKTSLKVKGFYRHDSSDSKRSHGDLRLCNLNYAEDQWQLTIGVENKYHPNKLGFHMFYGILAGNRSFFTSKKKDRPGSSYTNTQ